VSRRAFRGAVSAPRPLAAFAMVAAAGAALAATGQLRPFAIAAQAAGLALGLALRERPRALQRSAVVLNGLLLAAIGVAAALFLQGAPATVALAHFAALAQALQLLDARPRTSEFLLVSLALFQVVLATTLTDSILFPALLVVFLPATVWTLLVHTLRAEALEAGDPAAAARVTTPGLLRTAVLGSTLSVLVALALFLVLPRMRTGIVRGPGLGGSLPAAGFSDAVELGELGRIRSDPRAVLHVETLSGRAPAEGEGYWRGLAFDHFDGRRWSVTPETRSFVGLAAENTLDLDPRAPEADLVQRVVREPVAAGALFAAGTPRRLGGPLGRVERDANGGLYAPSLEDARVAYTVATRSGQTDRAALRADRAAPPRGDPAHWLALPPLSPGIAELAREITAGAEDDAGRAARLEAWLRQNGRYTDVPPRLDPDDLRSPVEVFLERGVAGHCEYFATAMVVLARSLGLPARLVNGFAGGRANAFGDFVTLTRADAHAWVELHFERAGWVRYDPTPPDLRTAAAGAPGIGARLGELASAVELWWFEQVVDFDRSDQARALRAAWLGWRRWRAEGRVEAPDSPRPDATALDPRRLVDPRALAAAALVVGAALALGLWRRRPHAALRVPSAYAAALRLLARRGLVRDPATPARAFAAAAAGSLPAPAAEAFARLTERYLAARFGGRPADGADDELRSLRDSLRA
jgi:transglutaminase-like putative cysteine protease